MGTMPEECHERLQIRTNHPTIGDPQLATELLEKFLDLWTEPRLEEVRFSFPFPPSATHSVRRGLTTSSPSPPSLPPRSSTPPSSLPSSSPFLNPPSTLPAHSSANHVLGLRKGGDLRKAGTHPRVVRRARREVRTRGEERHKARREDRRRESGEEEHHTLGEEEEGRWEAHRRGIHDAASLSLDHSWCLHPSFFSIRWIAFLWLMKRASGRAGTGCL